MKRLLAVLAILILILGTSGCQTGDSVQIAATTLPVYDLTVRLCEGTDLRVEQIVTESISCLHDYTLQVTQMRTIEGADTLILSGAGLEDFLGEALYSANSVIDASSTVELLCPEEHHEEHHGHSHDSDPHIWLSPENAKIMSSNICRELCTLYPGNSNTFQSNLTSLTQELDALVQYGKEQLSDLSCRELITFHDGFAYLADAFDLTILKAVEEESGSEASAAELIELVQLVEDHKLPAIFTECNGSTSAAKVIAAQTGCKIFSLDMAMAGESYFDAMYRNIHTIKEALG